MNRPSRYGELQNRVRFLKLLLSASVYTVGIGLLLGFFTVFLVHYMISPPEEGGLGLQKSVYSLTLALCVLAYMFTTVIAGSFSDGLRSRYGNRIPFITSGGTSIAVVFIIAYLFLTNNQANELWLIAIILFILISIARGIAASPFQALMTELFEKDQRGWVAIARTFFSAVGTGIAVFAFPPLAKQYKYTEMFLIIAAVFLVVTLITGLSIPKINPDSPSNNGLFNILDIPKDLWNYGRGKFGKMLICQIFWGLGTGTINYFWVLYVIKRLDASVDDTVIILVVLSACAALFAIPIGFLTSKLGKIKVGILASIAYIIFIFLLMTAPRVENVYFYAPIGGLAIIGLATIIESLPADLVPEGKEAKFFGINTVFSMFPDSITLVIAGLILGGFITDSEAIQFNFLLILAMIEIGIATLVLLWIEYESPNSFLYYFTHQWSKFNGKKDRSTKILTSLQMLEVSSDSSE